jgi:tRNA pseudouridine38-40 synthase
LAEVGRGARATSWLERVLLAADRRAAGPTAPPQGLFLVNVVYDGESQCASRTSLRV